MQAGSGFTIFSNSSARKGRGDQWSARRRVGFSMLFAASIWAVLILAVLEVSHLVRLTGL